MKQVLSIFLILAFLVATPSAFALDYGITVKNSGDPCQNPNVAKSSAAVSLSSATTGTIVAGVTGKVIYVCDFTASLSGTAANAVTAKLFSGATTTNPCDTSSADKTGTFTPTGAAGSPIHMGFGGTVFSVSSGKSLCSVTTGTSPGLYGSITYVQQ